MQAEATIVICQAEGECADASIAAAIAQNDVRSELVLVGRFGAAPPSALTRKLVADRRLRLLEVDASVGRSRARNLGVAAGSGRWLAFLDAGDVWAPEHLRGLTTRLEDAGAWFGCSAAWVVRHDYSIRSLHGPSRDDGDFDALLSDNHLGPPGAVIARRVLWDRFGGFDEWLQTFEAWDLWLRWARTNEPLVTSQPTAAIVTRPDDEPALRRRGREFRELARRYRGDATAAGVAFGGDAVPRRLAHANEACGRRLAAVGWHATAGMRGRSLPPLGRAATLLLGRRLRDGDEPDAESATPPWLEELELATAALSEAFGNRAD